MRRDQSDGITAYLQGGLGNQLFILAAAWAQSERLECPLYIDVSSFRLRKNRDFALAGLLLPGEVVTHWVDMPPRTIRKVAAKIPKLSKWAFGQHYFEESSFNYSPDIDSILPGTTIIGYFQSPKYFTAIQDKLFELLTGSSPKTERDAHYSAKTVSIHVRRGDYMNPETLAFHGLAGVEYFQAAICEISKPHKLPNFKIFSDDPTQVPPALSNRPDSEIDFSDINEDALTTLLRMSAGSGLIMSNSSFSWWAGWLMSHQERDAEIIYPSPWFASGQSVTDLVLPNWTSLYN